MDGHVTVNVQNFAVDDQTSETADKALPYSRGFQVFTEKNYNKC